jgi:hypothetical protein
MIPEAGFLFSIAGLNASFAGLGGLLIGLRRGQELRPEETLRLRQVVEFAFANLLLAMSLQPLVVLVGSDVSYRIAAAMALAYVALSMGLLQRRVERAGIAWVLTLAGVWLASATILMPDPALYELLLVALLARPMAVFVLVLGTLDAD